MPVCYICDPEKNRKCRDRCPDGCWYIRKGPCKCTTQKKYAKRDIHGKPIEAQAIDIWNDEYHEYLLFFGESENSDR